MAGLCIFVPSAIIFLTILLIVIYCCCCCFLGFLPGFLFRMVVVSITETEDKFMRVAKRSGEYKLTRKHGHYSMTFYTDSTKRVNTDIQKELRVSILTPYPGNTFEFTPAKLNEYGQPRTDQPLTFSVSQQKNDNHASCCTTKWKIKLYKLRAHWDQNWGSNKFAWLKLFVADDCYLNIRITYDKERQSKFKSMWYQRNKERRRQRKRVA